MLKYNISEEDLWSYWEENKKDILGKKILLVGIGSEQRPYYGIFLEAENLEEPQIVLVNVVGDEIDSTRIYKRTAEEDMEALVLQAEDLMNSGEDNELEMFVCDNIHCSDYEHVYDRDDEMETQECPICKKQLVPLDIYMLINWS